MNKLVFDNVIIEQSSKDIPKGVKYDFCENFNLVCGENETGKSSLMLFIKEGLFRIKGVDTGKINMSLISADNSVHIRADIKDNRSLEQRCKLFYDDNSSCGYDFIEKMINPKYFEQGFHINLDDLMKIQTKETSQLVNVIKDPSGEKIRSFVEKINNEINSVLSKDGKLKKDYKEIKDKIAEKNLKINELSKKEDDYIKNINSVKLLEEQLKSVVKQEEFFNILLQIKELKDRCELLNTEKLNLLNSFNSKLYENQKDIGKIHQDCGVYNLNNENIKRNCNSIEEYKNKILEQKAVLASVTDCDMKEETINQFVIDVEKNKKVEDYSNQINEMKQEIKAKNIKIDDSNDTILKIETELESLNKELNNNTNISEAEKLYKDIEEGLKQFYFISSEINKYEPLEKSSKNNGITLIMCILAVILSGLCGFCFYKQIYIPAFISILGICLIILSFFILKTNNNSSNKNEILHLKNQQKDILNSLVNSVKDINNEIEKVDYTYIPSKLESIKQEIYLKMQENKKLLENIKKLQTEKNYNETKLTKEKDTCEQINKNINELNARINDLIDKNIFNCDIKPEKYLETIEIIKSLKNDIKNLNSLENENQNALSVNKEISEYLRNFLMVNEIPVTISERADETINNIEDYNSENNKIKKDIEIKECEIKTISEKLENLENLKDTLIKNYNFNPSLYDIKSAIEELNIEKETKLNQKKEAEYQKRDLEKFEGLSDLKLERNILTDEYRKTIKKLIINKMTIMAIEKAKSEFDKTQPDLINAQKYLSILTGGKYNKINLELQEIDNEEGTKNKKWEELSRGTKEQLYLALKLGYASNYTKDKTTLEDNGKPALPLIIDDAFVNFDKNRTVGALKCLFEFSKTNQVIFFTCHREEIKKIIQDLFNQETNYKIIDM